jgi:long-chain acyl-CoA synthetase
MGNINTVADIVRVHGVERADHPALVLGDRSQTWGELYQRAQRMAGLLAAAGVGPDDRVAYLDKNSIEHFEIAFGAALLNAVSVDVNWRLAPPEVQFIVEDAGAKVFVVGPEFVPVLDAIRDQLPSVCRILVVGDDYDAALTEFEPVDPRVPSAADDTAMQLYSSGTTGHPKGVMLSNNNFFSLVPAAAEMWEIGADSVNLAAMPLFHIGGSGWATAGMFHGCTTVLVRDIDPSMLVRLIGDQRITHGFLVPAVLQFMLTVPGVDQADFSSLVMLAYGASPISEEVLTRSIATFGCKFWQVYGLTETTGAVVHLPPSDHDLTEATRHRLRSCGLPGPGVEVRIVDPDTFTDASIGEVGEIWMRSPQVMKGYWNNPSETARCIDADGWFRTGDAGYLDDDGYLYIHDRVKDMIVSGGENVYPAEVENALMSHPGIADVAVIGVPDDKWGETPKAMVVRATGADVTEADVIAYARERLAKFKCPTSVEWLDALPRNPSGKILKKDLRAPYWEGRTRNVN